MVAAVRLGTLSIFLTTLPTSHPWCHKPSQRIARNLAIPPTPTYASPIGTISSQRDDIIELNEEQGEVYQQLNSYSFEPCPVPADQNREAKAWRAVDMPALVNRVARHAATVPGAEHFLHGASLASSSEAARKQYAVVAETSELLVTDNLPPLEHDLDLTKCLGSTFSSSSSFTSTGSSAGSNSGTIRSDVNLQRSANLGLNELMQVDGAVKALGALAKWSNHPTMQRIAPQLAGCVDFDFDAHLAKLHACLDGAVVIAPSDRSKPQDGTPPKLQLASRKWPALDAARNRENALRSEVNRLVASLEATAGSSNSGSGGRPSDGLDIRQWNGRTVVSTPRGSKRKAIGPKRGTSRSGKTAYAEPRALVGPTDAYLAAVSLREAEEETVRSELSAEVRAHAAPLAAAVRSAASVDALVARARYGAALGSAVVPQVGNEGMIRIRGLTSPILPTSASTIANDLFLGHLKSDSNIAYRSSTDTSSTSTFSGSNLESSEIHAGSSPSSLNSLSSSGSSSIGREGGHSALVISGQNAGGKTVALKDFGAAVFMARLGIPLQTSDTKARIDFFRVVADLGDGQSVEAGLSTFQARVRVWSDALALAGDDAKTVTEETEEEEEDYIVDLENDAKADAENSDSSISSNIVRRRSSPPPNVLVLLDELGGATEAAAGGALAASLLEALVDDCPRARVVCSTHHDAVKECALAHPSMAVAAMRPRFTLSYGIVGESNAMAAAESVGLPNNVLARARKRLGLSDDGDNDNGGSSSSSLVGEKERLVAALSDALQSAKNTEASMQAQLAEATQELEEVVALKVEAQGRLRSINEATVANKALFARREANLAEALASEGLSPDLDELLMSALSALRNAQAGEDQDQDDGASLKGRLAQLGARWPVLSSQWPLTPGAVVVVAREGLSFGLQGTVLGQSSDSKEAEYGDNGERVVMVRVGSEPMALSQREIAVWDTGESDTYDERDSRGSSMTTASSSGTGRAYSRVYPGGLSAEVSRRLAAEARAKGLSPLEEATSSAHPAGGGGTGENGDNTSRSKSSAARKLARGLKRKAAKKSNGNASAK